MKKNIRIFITVLTVLILSTGVIAHADSTVTVSEPVIDSGSQTDSDAAKDIGYVNTETEAKKLTWAYYVIGGLTVAGVITAAVMISKKQK